MKWFLGMEQVGHLDVQQGNLVKTFFQWGKYFHISLNVTVTEVPDQNMNIFRFMKNDQDFKYPALSITSNKKFLFEYNVSGNSYVHEHAFDLNQSYKLAVRKFSERGEEFKFQIAVNGNLVYESGVILADEVSSIKYYLSQPMGKAFTQDYGKVESVLVISDEACEFEDPNEDFKTTNK